MNFFIIFELSFGVKMICVYNEMICETTNEMLHANVYQVHLK